MEIYKDKLIQKISNKDIVIGVIGLGYVGLPLALCFIEQSFKIIGFDIDKNKNLSLNKGQSYIESIPSKLINNAIKKGFLATDDFSKTKECDALIICVPTPLNKYREPDLSYVLSTMNLISPFLNKGKIISLESTTWPGTTEELLLPILAGIFVMENLSVILQVSYFKYTRKKYGEGRRIFKMSPLHHHYQKSGYHESKIVVRFWIIGILLAVFTIVTLKLR